MVRWSRFARYSNEFVEPATATYAAIAAKHGLNMAQMALAFVRQQALCSQRAHWRDHHGAAQDQPGSSEIQLSQEVNQELDAVHRSHPSPCP